MIDEVQQLRAERDRYASLVGTAYGPAGTIIPALENAARQEDRDQMRREVEAVIEFLRQNDPNRTE